MTTMQATAVHAMMPSTLVSSPTTIAVETWPITGPTATTTTSMMFIGSLSC